MLRVSEIEGIILKVGKTAAALTIAQAIYDAEKEKWKSAMAGATLQVPQPLWSYEPPQTQESSAVITARIIFQTLANQTLGPESQKAYIAALHVLTEQMSKQP